MGRTLLAWVVAVAVLVAGGMEALASSWYEAAGELAGCGEKKNAGEVAVEDDGARMRETVEEVAAAGAFATVRLADDPVSTAGIFLGRVILVPSNGARGLAAHSITTLAREMERYAA